MMDPLSVFDGLSTCDVCGCIQQSGTFRCPECGTFHSNAHLEERPDPPKDQRQPKPPVDPAHYSMNPQHEIPVEEEVVVDDMTTSWSGGSSDFHFTEDEGDATRQIAPGRLMVPGPELLYEEE